MYSERNNSSKNGHDMTIASLINRQYRLAARPAGLPKAMDWNLTSEAVRDISDGEVLIQVLYLSLDPAMRGWMNEGKSYIPPVAIGEVMRAGGIGKVLASQSPRFCDRKCRCAGVLDRTSG
jgi:hypothetical protein